MVGQIISHYEVVEKLGEGGMGVVYKAKDALLGRFVAIKILPASFGQSPDRKARFLQEARAASSLNHPNIITIHEIAATPEGDSIVMEYVRGQTLADMISAGRMRPVDIMKLAMQVADALAAAHTIGIVHRDLKPANVMVTPEGLAKVLDFGLAKLSNTGAAVDLDDTDVTRSVHMDAHPRTAEGAIIGTVAYMSPEQAEGQRVDSRSDIFSFGSVLYEMCTGQKAFRGKSSLETLTAVLRDQPRPFAVVGVADAPPELEELVMRCLRKDPDQRCQSMIDVKDSLERMYFAARSGGVSAIHSGVWNKPAPVRQTPSVAVLPFLNLSSDKENEYFSDGLAEEIINALTHIDNLKVTARTSAFAFRGTQKDVRQIGETLNVASVLEGSVRKAGNRVRISVQLIGVAEGNNLWSERFDREMTDVFEIQDEISQAIVGVLKVKLASQTGSQAGSAPGAPAAAAPLIKRYTENLEAYNLYLKGRFELNKMTLEGLDGSGALFEEAIRLDPNYALAHEGLADCWYNKGFLGFAPPREAMPKARASARHALELDETVAEAHATLGVIMSLYDWDWPGAERELMRAVELNPASPVTRDLYAFYFLRPVGRIEQAIAELQTALTMDPLSILIRAHLGFLYYVDRKLDEAIGHFRKVLEMSPNYYLGHAMMGMAYGQAQQHAEALECLARAQAADIESKFVDSLRAMTLASAGRRAEAEALTLQIIRRAARDYISPVSISYIWTALGDFDRAFASLDQAVHDRDPNIVGLMTNPIFDPIRGDPRYHTLVKKLQLA